MKGINTSMNSINGITSRGLITRRRSRHYSPLTSAVFTIVCVVLWSAAAMARAAPESFADLAEEFSPAVVNVSSTQMIEGGGGLEPFQFPPGSPFEEFFREFRKRQQPDQPRRGMSLGSGFIIDPDGYIVTNNHVIAEAEEITVILQDNTALKAKIIGRDTKTDLALHVEQGAARIATVDGSIGLDKIIIGAGSDVTGARRDDAGGHRTT